MIDNNFENSHQVFKCIWMETGIIDYKLCNIQFDCEQCEFDKALKRQSLLNNSDNLPEEKQPPIDSLHYSNLKYQYFNEFLSGINIRLNYTYHSSHLWTRNDNDFGIEFGMEPIVFKLLEPVHGVKFPEKNKIYKIGDMLISFNRNGRSIPFHSPVEGEIIKINPELVNGNWKDLIYNNEYLFKMAEIDSERNKNYKLDILPDFTIFNNVISILSEYFDKAINGGDKISDVPTLMDGGAFENNLENALGKKLYNELISMLFIV